jgi:hypothetical protein
LLHWLFPCDLQEDDHMVVVEDVKVGEVEELVLIISLYAIAM